MLAPVTVLLLNRTDRLAIYERNRAVLPRLSALSVPDGRDEESVIRRFRATGMKYIRLDSYPDQDFRTYGTLSNFIAHFEAIVQQVERETPFSLVLEDDVIVYPPLFPHVARLQGDLTADPSLNLIRLGPWGEGYLIPIVGARRILRCLCRVGIRRNIDITLRNICDPERYVPVPTGAWSIAVEANRGHSSRTRALNETRLRAGVPAGVCQTIHHAPHVVVTNSDDAPCSTGYVKSESWKRCVRRPWSDFVSCVREIAFDAQVCHMHEWMVVHCRESCLGVS
jgi:hypothetical protein